MAIHTIDDYLSSSKGEIDEAKKLVTVYPDVERYLFWANSPQGAPVEGSFALGHDHERGLGLHPSEFTDPGVCLLRLYFGVTGEVPRDEDVSFFGMDATRRQMILDTGTLLHLQHQAYLKHMYGERVDIEIRIKDLSRYIRSSHIDACITFPTVRFGFEFKTIKEGKTASDYGFQKIQRKPTPANRRQMLVYMKLADLPFGLVYYYNKNTSEVKEHIVEWSQDEWDAIDSEVVQPIVKSIKAREYPHAKVGGHCRQCPFRRNCHANAQEEKTRARRRKHQLKKRAVR